MVAQRANPNALFAQLVSPQSGIRLTTIQTGQPVGSATTGIRTGQVIMADQLVRMQQALVQVSRQGFIGINRTPSLVQVPVVRSVSAGVIGGVAAGNRFTVEPSKLQQIVAEQKQIKISSDVREAGENSSRSEK